MGKHPNIHELHQRLGTDRTSGKTYSQKHHKLKSHPLSDKPILHTSQEVKINPGDQLLLPDFDNLI